MKIFFLALLAASLASCSTTSQPPGPVVVLPTDRGEGNYSVKYPAGSKSWSLEASTNGIEWVKVAGPWVSSPAVQAPGWTYNVPTNYSAPTWKFRMVGQ